MKNEFEAKFINIDVEDIRKKLRENGFELKRPEFLMKRKTFNIPNNTENKWGRVRDEGDKITATIKYVKNANIIDGTIESELIIQDFDTGCNFLEMCGLVCKSYQENKRELWVCEDCECTIDTWPGLKPFIEVEAPSAEIVEEKSKKLGFDFSDAVYGGIDFVYEREMGLLREKMVLLPEVTFENPPSK